MKRDVCWFKHDANARRNQKLLTMRLVYGAEGYGWWWMLLEMMRESSNYRLKISGSTILQQLRKRQGADKDKIKAFLDDCVNEFHLFESDGEYIWSPSFLHRMKTYDEVIETKRAAIEGGISNQDIDFSTIHM